MKNKLSSALLGLFLMGIMGGCGDSDKKQENPISKPIAVQAEINPAFLEWEKKQDSKIRKSDGDQRYSTGYIPPLQKPTVHKVSNKQQKLLNGTATDSKFDLRDENLDGDFNDTRLTVIKDQGSCGACWAFATYGALESNIKIEENLTVDFSENHLKHNHGLELGPCSGGNMDIASAYLSRANGPVNESDDPYDANSTEANNSAVAVRYIENIVKLPVRANTSDNAYLKEALTAHGALYVDIHIYGMAEATADNNYSVYNSDNTISSDHAVLLVGWDDNYQAQGQTGAFILKNSWGTDWGENGYFYVPYTDTTLAFGEVAYFNDTPDTEVTKFDIVHDTAPNGAVTGIGYSEKDENNNSFNIPIYGLSVYTIEENQTIKSVGIHNKGDDTNISVTFFKNVSFDDNLSISIPTDTETFNHITKGWNTLQLQTPIELNSSLGQFAVQIVISENGGNPSLLPLDGNYTFSDGTPYSRLNAQANQSFEGYNGSNWNDLFATNNSIAIKVFAQSKNNETNTSDTNTTSEALLSLIWENIATGIDANLTAEQYNSIDGVSGALIENEQAYQEYINAHPELFTLETLAGDVQSMIDTVNAGWTNSPTFNYVSTGVLTPNGGENWYFDQNETIHWDNAMIFGDDVTLYLLEDENTTVNDFNLSTLLSTRNWYMFEQNASNIVVNYNINPRDLNFIGETRLLVVSNQTGDWDISDNTFMINDVNNSTLTQDDLDFINEVTDDINGIKARLNSQTIPNDLNNTINGLFTDIQTLLESNPLDYALINSTKEALFDYESIVGYLNELNEIRDSINNIANLSSDSNNTLQILISDIESNLTVPLDKDTINSIFEQLNDLTSSLSSDTNSGSEENNTTENNTTDDSNIYGNKATIIHGTVVLSTDMNLTPESECFDEYTHKPLSSCNGVFIDLFDSANAFLGSAIVQPDGNYTLYFKEIFDTTGVTVKLHTIINGVEEFFYRDFGDDHTISDDDSFKSEKEITWQESNTSGVWIPNVNYLNIETQVTELNLDLTTKDNDKYILSGTVQVPADFIPGEIRDENGDWKGWNMVSLTAINTATGEQYWTEIGKTQTDLANTTYPFSLKLPKPSSDYIIKIEKMSDKNWVEMYLDDESNAETSSSDHDFDGDEVLVSAMGVDWKDNGNGTWTPDINKTGYFTVNSNVENIAIDIASYGANFKKIEGHLSPPSDFDLSNSQNNIYIEIIDAKTGYWLNNVAVQNDGNYSILLGDTINENGYILKVNLDHWDSDNWENSYWKSFYLNFTDGANYEFKDESEVRWEESTDEATGQFYWIPNVQPLIITDTTTLNINLNLYQAPVTYTVSGTLSGLPSSAKWINIYLYDPTTYIGKNTELKEDGSFMIKELKAGSYIMNIGYSDENDGYRYYDYLVVDDNGDFTTGTTLKESMEVKWVPFATDGTVIPESDINVIGFDWNSVAYWAPKETDSQKTLMHVTSDVALGEITIPQPVPPSNLIVSLSGVDANTNVDFNLFVPNEPIGRWESNTSLASGAVSINITDLKARDDYQLQVWVNGIEYWYNATTDTLTSDHYDGSGFTIAEGATKELLNLAVPNDKRTITATLALGSDYSNKNVNVYLWQTVSPYNYTGESFTANSNGDVNVTLSVKEGSNYIMEVYNPETWNGFTVDVGTGTQTSGDESLILAQNSWEVDSNGMWNPKASVLIDMSNDLDLGALTPPALKTVTFTLTGLAVDSDGNITEDVWIALENNSSHEWYGSGNGDWSDWRNPIFSNSLSMKVPETASTYYIYMYTMNHESGLIDENGNDSGHDIINVVDASPDTATIDFSNSGSAKVTWDFANADTITISDDTNISLTLKSTDDYKSIIGLVTLGAGDIEAGWMCANSPTNGNCGEVDANGTYEINGLSPTDGDVFTVQYWANSGDTFNTSATWADASINLTVDMNIELATKIDITGTVTDSDISTKPVETVLLDVNGTDWKVLDAQELNITTANTAVNFSFANLAPEITGHHYEVAVASTEMNATTGVTTYTVQDAIQKDGTTTTTNITDDTTITISSSVN